MNQQSKLIQKTYFAILTVNIVSMVAGIAAVMIDAIIIGQFLGTDAVTAIGLLNPVIMGTGFLGAVFASGFTIVCTRYMGMARADRVNQVFSVGMAAILLIGCTLSAVLGITGHSIAQMLKTDSVSEQTAVMMREYLQAFSVGVVAQYFFMTVAALSTIDNDRRCSILGMFTNLGSNIVLDLLNVLVFHKGMWGMAMATSISFLAGALVLFTHFLKKERVLHLTRTGLSVMDLKEVFLCGLPAGIALASKAVLTFAFNSLLLHITGQTAVAAFSAYTSLFGPINYVVRGYVASTSTMCSLMYGEEDRKGLLNAYSISTRTALTLLGSMSVLLILLARPAAGLFLQSDAAEVLTQTARFIRVAAAQLLLMSVSFALSGAWQGLRHIRMNYILDILRECVLPLLCVIPMSLQFGLNGFETSFPVSGVLVLMLVWILPSLRNRKLSYAGKDVLILPDDFGSAEEDIFEATVRTMQDVTAVSEQIRGFCLQKGTGRRTSMMLALFAEEMASNAVEHGFSDKKPGYLDIRYVYSPEKQVIRFRDNGKPFDPVEWLKRNQSEDKLSGAGIRIVVGLANEVSYIPALGLNNLMITMQS